MILLLSLLAIVDLIAICLCLKIKVELNMWRSIFLKHKLNRVKLSLESINDSI